VTEGNLARPGAHQGFGTGSSTQEGTWEVVRAHLNQKRIGGRGGKGRKQVFPQRKTRRGPTGRDKKGEKTALESSAKHGGERNFTKKEDRYRETEGQRNEPSLERGRGGSRRETRQSKELSTELRKRRE